MDRQDLMTQKTCHFLCASPCFCTCKHTCKAVRRYSERIYFKIGFVLIDNLAFNPHIEPPFYIPDFLKLFLNPSKRQNPADWF